MALSWRKKKKPAKNQLEESINLACGVLCTRHRVSERGVVCYCELLCFAITTLPAIAIIAIISIIIIQKEYLGSVGNIVGIV